MIISELLGETQAFVECVQQQFKSTGTWDMPKLESGLRKALLKDGCHILEGLLNQPNALGDFKPVGTLHDNRPKQIRSLLGPFELVRGYYQHLGDRFFPMDEALGMIDSYTPGLAKMMCRAASTDGSFEEAEETLQIYAGVDVPASQIRKMAQEVGPDIGQWSKEREEARCDATPTLYVEYDGTGVPMRKEETKGRKGKQPDGSSATREAKLGTVFTSLASDEKGRPIRDHNSTTYVASFEKSDVFGELIRKEARLRGLGRAERVAVLGDGAHWIWKLALINFPKAKQILDFYHACEHLGVLASALYPSHELNAKKLVDEWTRCLETDKVLKVVATAEKLSPHHGPRRNVADREIEYFRRNAHRMMYATFKREGYFVGSGVVEAGCKTVVGKRTKQSGMFWQVCGAQNILDIRCSVLSDTYDLYWMHRRQVGLQAIRTAA